MSGELKLQEIEKLCSAQRYAEAEKLLLELADDNNDVAQYNLGVLYSMDWKGKNMEKALDFMDDASCSGNVNACFNLGVMYETGIGVPCNFREALGWFEAGADGDAECAKKTGDYYLKGLGAPSDPEKAKKYYKMAAEGGNRDAREALKTLDPELYKSLPPVPDGPISDKEPSVPDMPPPEIPKTTSSDDASSESKPEDSQKGTKSNWSKVKLVIPVITRAVALSAEESAGKEGDSDNKEKTADSADSNKEPNKHGIVVIPPPKSPLATAGATTRDETDSSTDNTDLSDECVSPIVTGSPPSVLKTQPSGSMVSLTQFVNRSKSADECDTASDQGDPLSESSEGVSDSPPLQDDPSRGNSPKPPEEPQPIRRSARSPSPNPNKSPSRGNSPKPSQEKQQLRRSSRSPSPNPNKTPSRGNSPNPSQEPQPIPDSESAVSPIPRNYSLAQSMRLPRSYDRSSVGPLVSNQSFVTSGPQPSRSPSPGKLSRQAASVRFSSRMSALDRYMSMSYRATTKQDFEDQKYIGAELPPDDEEEEKEKQSKTEEKEKEAVPAAEETKATVHKTPEELQEDTTKLLRYAEKGSVQAQRLIGLRYQKGVGVQQDTKKAVKWLKKAAERGDAVAMNNLAVLLLTGQTEETEKLTKAMAEEFLEAAACDGDVVALRNLAKVRAQKNKEETLQILMAAAEKGDAASVKIAGAELQRRGNAAAAEKLLRRAAEEHKDPESQYRLAAVLFAGGPGVKRNIPEAKMWLKKAAEGGYPYAQERYNEL